MPFVEFITKNTVVILTLTVSSLSLLIAYVNYRVVRKALRIDEQKIEDAIIDIVIQSNITSLENENISNENQLGIALNDVYEECRKKRLKNFNKRTFLLCIANLAKHNVVSAHFARGNSQGKYPEHGFKINHISFAYHSKNISHILTAMRGISKELKGINTKIGLIERILNKKDD